MKLINKLKNNLLNTFEKLKKAKIYMKTEHFAKKKYFPSKVGFIRSSTKCFVSRSEKQLKKCQEVRQQKYNDT